MERLNLNKKIYSLQCIKQASEAFSGLCRINLIESDPHIIVEFSRFKYLPERTVKEFENFLIELENQ